MAAPRYLFGLGVLLLILTGYTAPTAEIHPLLHGKVDVGGYKLYIDCTGTGRPTVVLDGGYGHGVDWWNVVQPAVASFTRVCSYDRAGVGNSDPRKMSAGTSDQVVKELHTLLRNAHIPGPYVLAGHSLGGLNIRLYAHQHRSQVAGIVEVDGAVEGLCTSGFSACPSGDEDIDIIASMAQSARLHVESSRGPLAPCRSSFCPMGWGTTTAALHGIISYGSASRTCFPARRRTASMSSLSTVTTSSSSRVSSPRLSHKHYGRW